MKKVLALLILIFQSVLSFSKNVSVFIDISGSMDPLLPGIQKYICQEFIPELDSKTTLRIYKFYGKLRTPPIFSGTLERINDIEFAKSRVNDLIANGPWTNLTSVLDFVVLNCTEYGDEFVIFTDGRNELEDGSASFVLSDAMVKEKLGKNAQLIERNGWKTVEFVYEKNSEKKEDITIAEDVEKVPEVIVSENVVETTGERLVSEEAKGEFKIYWILIPILLILIIVLVVLFCIFVLPRLGKTAVETAVEATAETTEAIVNGVGDVSKEIAREINNRAQETAQRIKDFVEDHRSNNADFENERDRKISRTPNRHVSWTGERGDSKAVATEDGLNEYFDGKESDILIFNEQLSKHGVDGIEYKDGEPDFTPVSEYSCPVPEGTLTGDYNKNVPKIHEILAKSMNERAFQGRTDWTKNSVKEYCASNWLALHESPTGEIQLVHSYIHGLFTHEGLRAKIRRNG